MFALVIVVLSGLVLGSAATAGERSAEGPAEEMPGGSAQGRAQVERLIEEDARRREAREAELAGSDARAERTRSRGAHKRQSEQEARVLLRREFGGLLDSLFFDPAELTDGGRIAAYVGDYAAVVETASGQRLLESQGLPLRARDRSGRRSQVDLELRDRGAYVAPGNPLVELRLPERLADGVAFGSGGVRIHLESPTRAADATGEPLDDRRMVYPVGSDTEFVAQPAAGGVELFWQLRSEDSPQRQTLRFELPEGARLRETQGGAIEVVRGDEKLAEVAPPRAIDAQGQDVPTSMSLRGEEIDVTARHAGGDFAYPILLDPVVQDWNAFILRSDALANWRYYTNRTDRFQTQFVCNPFVSCGTGEGLFHYAPPGPYNHNDFAESFYAPPCTDARYSESCDGTLYLNGGSPVTRSTYLLTTLARDSGGVERLYYYHWLEPKAATDNRAWDSGLLSPNGETRPAYTEFASRP